MPEAPWAIAIHGGAGLIRRDGLSVQRERACRAVLMHIVQQAGRELAKGLDAIEVAKNAVVGLEETPLFNAGKGSVLSGAGVVELDAAVMDGRDRSAGAITSCRNTRNPVLLADAVRTQTPHVLLAGSGADAFAKTCGLALVKNTWFITDERREQLAQMQAKGAVGLDHGGAEQVDKYGTVGAVVCDSQGHVAAATSTGGMCNKRSGRVGDTPLIGAGTFAWNQTCAVSGTGHGEPFMRLSIGARLSAWMDIGGLTLQDAAQRVVHHELPQLNGLGGLIAVDGFGRVAMPFNTAGMFRAHQCQDDAPKVGIW